MDLNKCNPLGDVIREAREYRGLSRKELGEIVRLDQNRIQQYENGLRVPKEDLFLQIINALEVSVEVRADYILRDEKISPFPSATISESCFYDEHGASFSKREIIKNKEFSTHATAGRIIAIAGRYNIDADSLIKEAEYIDETGRRRVDKLIEFTSDELRLAAKEMKGR